MTLPGQAKMGRCQHCGRKVKLVYQFSHKWKGYCEWCRQEVVETEGDTTKVGGQL